MFLGVAIQLSDLVFSQQFLIFFVSEALVVGMQIATFVKAVAVVDYSMLPVETFPPANLSCCSQIFFKL